MVPEYVEKNANMIRELVGNKYDASGIYCLRDRVRGQVLYVGQSKNMVYRLANHLWNRDHSTELKYQIMRELRRRKVELEFDVLCYCSESELDVMEWKWIKEYDPPLNTYRCKDEVGKFRRDQVRVSDVRVFFGDTFGE